MFDRAIHIIFALTLLFAALYKAEAASDDPQAVLQAMEQRLERLEMLITQQQLIIDQLRAETATEAKTAVLRSTAPSTAPEPDETEVEAGGLEISGVFDVQARSVNHAERTFELGDLEVALEYEHDEHFSASAALAWAGDEAAEVAVALVDYHLFNDNIPPRGRIFSEPGFHLQLGRFDIPFAADYQYFSSADRPNITAPMTTERIQDGGFNGDGLRAYGSWNKLDGALFWTNSLYADSGYAVGGRFGLALGPDTYSFHQRDASRDIELGLSYLLDRDGSGDDSNRVSAIDLTLRFSEFILTAEYFRRRHEQGRSAQAESLFAERDESGYHLSLLADMQPWLGQPLSLFGRYESWQPDYEFIPGEEDDSERYRVTDLARLTLGLRYTFTDYFQFKLEYFDHLGDDTEEPDFEQSLGIAQVVVSF